MDALNEQMAALPVSRWGKWMYRYFPYRKHIILKNIDQVYGNKLDSVQKKHLTQAFYTHLLRCIAEIFAVRWMSEETLRQKVDVIGHEHLLKVAEAGQGVLVLTSHLGSFEVAPIGGILNFKQFQGRFHFIRRTLSNKRIEQLLFRRYYRAGLHVITKQNALQHVTSALANNDAVVFVLDQHASLVNRDGIAVEFFGKKAGTYRSLASCSRYTGVPVVPAASYRLNNGRHVLEFLAPIEFEERATTQESLYYNTLRYNQALERMILKHPEQWMWLHRRWKLKESV